MHLVTDCLNKAQILTLVIAKMNIKHSRIYTDVCLALKVVKSLDSVTSCLIFVSIEEPIDYSEVSGRFTY